MPLIKVYSRVDKDGKIKIPENIKREARLKAGQLLEMKIMGANRKSILITFPLGKIEK